MSWMHHWRLALPRALFIATTLTATPAGACPSLTLGELAERLPDSRRYEFAGPALAPFLDLWAQGGGGAFPASPDGVVLFVRRDRPILVAYRHTDCLLAVLPSRPADLWRAMRRRLGAIA
ncbi:MAG: hypothetical protein AB7I59_08185 [Geminicoccaceae bacterium]